MRLEYLNPFINSALDVLAEYTNSEVERGDVRLDGDASPENDVAAVITLAGEVEGRVILQMGRDTALNMAGIMNQEEFRDLTPLALDTIMELTNVMIARAVSTLNDQGFTFRLAPPLVFTGANLSSFGSLHIESLVVPLRARAGEMVLNVALRMKSL